MFAPFTEVVVHDLRTPKQAILAIHNNLSGRAVGDPATELGSRASRTTISRRCSQTTPTASRTAARRRAPRSASRIRAGTTWPPCA
ncbi:PAS domain-containing protein [Burkholderia multivorans]|uniref:PAS domain-containing protein n=1 Tax=Burkholderia multivorans TaxID=87883 RepID=UPI00358DE0EE